jgi:hypothetical protein
MRIKWLDAEKTDGRWVGDDDVIEDGGRVHIPMMLFDSNRTRLVDTFQLDGASLDQFRPGYRLLGDKARETVRNARQDMIDRATNAWRMDARKRKPPEPDEDDDDDEDQDEADARKKDARGFARRSPEGSRSGGPDQENNSHQGPQAQGSHDRLDGRRDRRDDLRRGALEARAAYVRDLQTAWKRSGRPNSARVRAASPVCAALHARCRRPSLN